MAGAGWKLVLASESEAHESVLRRAPIEVRGALVGRGLALAKAAQGKEKEEVRLRGMGEGGRAEQGWRRETDI